MKLFFLFLVVFSTLQVMIFYDKSDRTMGKKVFVAPIKSMGLFTFGYDSVISSLMWVRILQDIDVCDQTEEKQVLPSFQSRDILNEVLERKLPEAKCSEGWVYQMLDVITELTPDFYGAYLDGATMLSVVVDDRKGAQKLFAKAVVDFPEDWQILYRAAYHELFEMQNPGQAAKFLRLAGERGAPPWVYALSARIYSRLGQAAFAKTILESVLRRKSNGQAIERVRDQLKKVDEVLKNAR